MHCLSELAEAHEKIVQMPTKAGGNRWLDFKYTAFKNALEHFGIYLSHIEDLSNNDSQPKKRAELKGFLVKWEQATVPIHLAIYLDVLAPLRCLSLSLQSELHDPVTQIKRVQQFTWTMSKLKLIIDASIENEENITLIHYNRLLNEIKETDGAYLYQGITIRIFIASKNAVDKGCSNIIVNIAENMESRFKDLTTSPIFSNLTRILDVKTWPTKENDLALFAGISIIELGDCFETLLERNGCKTDLLLSEWITLKTHMIPIVKNNPDKH